VRYRVWAPRAREVSIVLEPDGDRIEMEPGAGGYFETDVARIGDGQRYWFSLDGGPPRPDPRSRFQPEGVHGPSQWVDLESFQWTDPAFQAKPLASAVIYELHVGTFTKEGTFDAVVEHLDHLEALGVTHVELMPVAHFPGERGWGYDGVALFAPHTAYGGPRGLQRLVDACHARGLAVLLDVVYNHLGPSGNYLGSYGPYFTSKYRTPWGDALNFDDRGCDEVRRYVRDNAKHWLRAYHIDGLRLDAIHAIFDQSATHILADLAADIEALSIELERHLVLIAESGLNDARVVNPKAIGGYGVDAQWSDDFHHSLHTLLTGERDGYYGDYGKIEHLAAALERGFVYDGRYSAFRGHCFGGDTATLRARQLICFSQNHDQVGNRAVGDRLSATLSVAPLQIAAAITLLGPFVPLLFMGEEWGSHSPFLYFTDHPEPELREAVRRGRRREFASFGWDPEAVPDPGDRQTFERSCLDWGERFSPQHARLLQWYGRLTELRRAHPPASSGLLRDTHVVFDEVERWLTFERGSLTINCHLGTAPRSWHLPSQAVLLASGPTRLVGDVCELEGPSVVICIRTA